MAQLAIKGHPERGKEVIEILEMLGGKNIYEAKGDCINLLYILCDGKIQYMKYTDAKTSVMNISTLEEFLEKFPYKVGDKIMIDDRDKANIVGMVWDNDIDEVFYEIQIGVEVVKYPKELLHPYIEKIITIDDFKTHTKEWLIDKLHGMIISNAIKTIGNIHDELHKPQYPKTYEECCEVLGETKAYQSVSDHKTELLEDFQKLLICRDAYWKIAGEQMRLEKSWEPDYTTEDNQGIYIITTRHGSTSKNITYYWNYILTFPTEKMRDAFYENFKDLIEQCKELL